MRIFKLAQSEVRTEDCVFAIVSDPRFVGTSPKDWKRQSKKRNDNGDVVREFVNRTTQTAVSVVEHQGDLTIDVPNATTTPDRSENTVSFIPLDYPSQEDLSSSEISWTGKMVFSIEDTDDDVVGFLLGPEQKNRIMDDTFDGGSTQKVEVLFADFTDKDIRAAENYHEITIPEGMSKSQLQKLVRKRLLSAGAVPCKELGSDPQNVMQYFVNR